MLFISIGKYLIIYLSLRFTDLFILLVIIVFYSFLYQIVVISYARARTRKQIVRTHVFFSSIYILLPFTPSSGLKHL